MNIYRTLESFVNSIDEARYADIHKAAKKGSYPVTIVVFARDSSGKGTVKHQETVGTPAAVPAALSVIKKKYPESEYHFSIEDATGASLWNESIEVNEKEHWADGKQYNRYEKIPVTHKLFDFWKNKVKRNYKDKSIKQMTDEFKIHPRSINVMIYDYLAKEPGFNFKSVKDSEVKKDLVAQESIEVNESKIELKRKYTENYPSVSAGKRAPIRNKIIEAIADGKLSSEEFNALVKELSSSSAKWLSKNTRYFNVSEDGVTLSKFGMRILNKIKTVNESVENNEKEMKSIHTTFNSFVNENYTSIVVNEELKAKKPNEKTEIDIDFSGDDSDLKNLEKKYGVKANEYEPGMVLLTGKKKDLLAYLQSPEYDMDPMDIEDLFPELLENYSVNEAFKSSKLASLLDLRNMDRQVMKGLYGFTKAKLDQVTDDQLIEMTPQEAYKSKRPNALFFYIVDNEKENPYADASAWHGVKRIPGGTLIAVADSDNKFYGISWGSRWSTDRSMTLGSDQGDGIGVNKRYKGYDASGLYNVKRIADLADRVLVFDWSIVPSAAEDRAARSAAKAGATAFMSDKDFKNENIKRYKSILQTRALNDDIDKMVEGAVNELADQIKGATKSMQLGRYGDILIGTSPKGKEVKLRDASSHMSNILDSYSRYVDYLNQAKKADEDQERGGGSYYKKEAAAYAKDIKDRVSKISKLEYAW